MLVSEQMDAVKRRERAQRVALFRYQLICPALEAGLSTKQRGRIVRGIAERTHAGPFGERCGSRGTPWTGGSAGTGGAVSMRCHRRRGSPAPVAQAHSPS